MHGFFCPQEDLALAAQHEAEARLKSAKQATKRLRSLNEAAALHAVARGVVLVDGAEAVLATQEAGAGCNRGYH
eukprot:2183006-Pleurochrysis_carterae.AAC.1